MPPTPEPPEPPRPVRPLSPAELTGVAIDLSHVDLARVRRVQGRLPAATNIKSLGVSASAANMLTPAAAQLTKQNLEDLRDGRATAQGLGLTVNDVNSIKTAFSTPLAIGAVGGDPRALSVSCCCCTPCCCAAAALDSRKNLIS
jgi:hypothetical protein